MVLITDVLVFAATYIAFVGLIWLAVYLIFRR